MVLSMVLQVHASRSDGRGLHDMLLCFSWCHENQSQSWAWHCGRVEFLSCWKKYSWIFLIFKHFLLKYREKFGRMTAPQPSVTFVLWYRWLVSSRTHRLLFKQCGILQLKWKSDSILFFVLCRLIDMITDYRINIWTKRKNSINLYRFISSNFVIL